MKLFLFTVTSIFIALLSACHINKNSAKFDFQTRYALINDSQSKIATCEKTLRDYVKKNSFEFIQTPQFSNEIKEITAIQNPDEDIINVYERDGQITEYAHTQTQNIKSINSLISKERSTSIGLNEKGDSNPFFFDLKYIVKILNHQKTELIQRFQVDSDCHLQLSRTTKTILNLADEKHGSYNRISLSYDNQILEKESKSFEIPKGKIWDDLDITPIDQNLNTEFLITKANKIFSYNPNLGVSFLKFNNQQTQEQLLFGELLSFTNIMASILFIKTNENDELKNIIPNEISFNVSLNWNNKISIFNMAGQKNPDADTLDFSSQRNMNLPFDKYFEKIYLGQAPETFLKIITTWEKNYLASHSQWQFETNKKVTYDHLNAYWDILSINESTSLENKTYIYKVQEKSIPQIESSTTDADLASNETIQTNLPEIVAIVQQIQKDKKNRIDQIQGVLDYLKHNYSYDYEMLNRSAIRPMTAKEALDRKKGVCQHYAVLFTTIARALKIPTRIVGGYLLLADPPGAHAWVEVEVKPGIWQVIEPQDPNALSQTQTRYYFPISRSLNLEDKSIKTDKAFSSFIIKNSLKFTK